MKVEEKTNALNEEKIILVNVDWPESYWKSKIQHYSSEANTDVPVV